MKRKISLREYSAEGRVHKRQTAPKDTHNVGRRGKPGSYEAPSLEVRSHLRMVLNKSSTLMGLEA